MARVCEITGRKALKGNKVSFSNKKSIRRFEINLIKKRFFVPSEDKWITLRLSAKALKTINRKGIDAVLAEARAQGLVKA
jgi:large subunit ribosomal protein L28